MCFAHGWSDTYPTRHANGKDLRPALAQVGGHYAVAEAEGFEPSMGV
ncbi:hypothetical protein BN10_620025 [Phycicoccus elongatus Lp2]|uniref:Uncharacterized protein n=1 Tax=Phycicoccus elongatus Lp2 TaxID=1193181 RepID=N0E5R8_9MICO|nr:hypothetical protein BN10_620025 [Phycicoccus elongatus Lp2]